MKTFFAPFIFVAVIFGFTVSVSADVAVLDWNNTGTAMVFAQEIATLNNDDGRAVTVDYALQGNVLYSRVQLDPNQYGDPKYGNPQEALNYMTRLGLTNMRFFGGNERADFDPESSKNFMPAAYYDDGGSNSIWTAFKAANNNSGGTITATFSSYTTTYDDDDSTQKTTFFDSTRLDSSNYDLEQYYKDGINDLYNNAGEGEFYEGPVPELEDAASAVFTVDENGDVVYKNGAATDSFPFYGTPDEELDSVDELGLTTSYTYNYVDGWLQVFDGKNGDFLFMVSSDPTNGTIQYAVNLSSLGLDNYAGIHIGSEIENYYTYLSFDEGVIAGTPEPATALILGFAGCFALPFLRRKTKSVKNNC
ncbi:MAG: hypothetical protein LBP87_12430 [Planctomycetaceae bacterium]|jgi:hypothetical protein|nr:hypothetical protein [Planctomycetaceae bacterium]